MKYLALVSKSKRAAALLASLASVIAFPSFAPSLHAAESQSVARIWNERALGAIRTDTPHPPAQARNLYALSVCMYDAWAAYDSSPQGAVGYIYRGKHTATDINAARREAISYAAYRLLRERHFFSRTALSTLAADDAQMVALGYSTNNISRNPSTPAGVGNLIYDAVSTWFSNDGSRQTNGVPYPQANPPVAYPDAPSDQGGYRYVNVPLPAGFAGITIQDVNKWQRLQIVNAVDQNGFPQGPIQTYLGAQWLGVRSFCLERNDPSQPWIDPGPPPYFNTKTHQEFIDNIVEVIRKSSELTPDDGVTMDISPGAFGNSTLGTNDGLGHPVNPATGQPYAPNVVKRGDFARVLAEFWADGPNSETPPGHWNTLANAVSDHPAASFRMGGNGPTLDRLEWDVKMYFALNAAVHDAACAAWGIKRYYNAWRPISAIRYVGQLGQSSNPSLPAYNPLGLPLIPNLIELATTETTAVSGRHAGYAPGTLLVLTWPGQPSDPVNTYQGVRWMPPNSWIPYQRTNFVTPAFPGYVSGHSSFSRAAAEVLTAFTGSPFFPGGMGTYTAKANISLGFEKGPSQNIVLQWGTYYDAADQAGLSRIWGGIHPPVDDFAGRRTGSQCGIAVWNLVQKYWNGSIASSTSRLALESDSPDQHTVRFSTLRGLYYKLQSSPDLNQPFTDEPGGSVQAFDSSIVKTNSSSGPTRFYRAISSLTP